MVFFILYNKRTASCSCWTLLTFFWIFSWWVLYVVDFEWRCCCPHFVRHTAARWPFLPYTLHARSTIGHASKCGYSLPHWKHWRWSFCFCCRRGVICNLLLTFAILSSKSSISWIWTVAALLASLSFKSSYLLTRLFAKGWSKYTLILAEIIFHHHACRIYIDWQLPHPIWLISVWPTQLLL